MLEPANNLLRVIHSTVEGVLLWIRTTQISFMNDGSNKQAGIGKHGDIKIQDTAQ